MFQLADPAVLDLRKPDAQVWNVGKRGGDASSVSQDEISNLLVGCARENPSFSIVRLKAGDPCLFGRSAEEISAIRKENIPFEIVPGVSSVSAAAAACGMSLTDKTFGRNVVTVSGHDPDVLDYASLGRMDTIAVLMAGKHLKAIMHRLIQIGRVEKDRHVYLVKWALRGDQEVLASSVQDVANEAAVRMPGGISPSVVIVSKVCRL